MRKFADKTEGGFEYEILKEIPEQYFCYIGIVKRKEDGEWVPIRWNEHGLAYDKSVYNLVPIWEPKDGEPVWVTDIDDQGRRKNWRPRISMGGDKTYPCYQNKDTAYHTWDCIAPWNNGTPPKEEK